MIKEKSSVNLSSKKKFQENKTYESIYKVNRDFGSKIPTKFVNMFKDLSKMLRFWKSGKIPKAFKIIPNLNNWEEILQLTNPETWSPNLMFYATKMFSSSLRNKCSQRFYNCVLLPSVRKNILRNKHLNYHYYQAVKKSLFKPRAFYKGFLIPLCQNRCTGREAVILSSILTKTSISRMETVATIYKLIEFPYSSPIHLFIKTLLNKNYSLPKLVISKLVKHFQRFQVEQKKMPVIWHQTFLTFVKRYKNVLTLTQKNSLKFLLKVQYHSEITSQIKKELFLIIN